MRTYFRQFHFKIPHSFCSNFRKLKEKAKRGGNNFPNLCFSFSWNWFFMLLNFFHFLCRLETHNEPTIIEILLRIRPTQLPLDHKHVLEGFSNLLVKEKVFSFRRFLFCSSALNSSKFQYTLPMNKTKIHNISHQKLFSGKLKLFRTVRAFTEVFYSFNLTIPL